MPIDPERAIGADLGEVSCSWTASEVLQYHLAIGAGARPGAQLEPTTLRWATEGALRVLPSFAVVAPTFHDVEPPVVDWPGVVFRLDQVVHASQSVTVHAPLPVAGTARVRTTLSDVWDKGKAAVIWTEAVATTEAGEPLWTTRSSAYVRGEGGFGGARGGSVPVAVPDRAPDAATTFDVAPNQALLYRLCGDRNPLHSDPAAARVSGFPAPILHGLCSWGITLRELTEHLLDGDSDRVAGFSARFSGVVFPGETLRIRGWVEDGRVVATTTVAGGERDGAPVLDDVVLTTRTEQ